jgi:6-phosphogluconolactonase
MNILHFKTGKELENDLANKIANQLNIAIQKNGKAFLLVSGGTSPIGIFQQLSLKNIDWQKITIGLVDERFVPNDNAASNERLVKENLMINEAKNATFIPMVYTLENESENLNLANQQYNIFHSRTDVSILGMGEDGHTASLFPNEISSEKNLLSDSICLISTTSPNAPTQRISCSKSLILKSNSIYLMLIGERKKLILQQALSNKLPIAYFIEAENKKTEIYYSEKK